MILPAQRALEKIAKGNLAAGYLLLGQEVYWRDRIWGALRRAMGFDAGASTGIEEMDLRRNSLDEILGRARDRNLWIPRQLILVRNAHVLSGAKPLEVLAAYFRDSSPDSVLVFEMTDVDLKSDDWREKEKIKSRQEHWGDLCEVLLLAAPSMAESLELVRREAGERGRKISPEAVENLMSILDGDLGRIVKEVEKLSLYRADGEEISAQDVEALVGQRGPLRGLSLPEAIGTGDAGKILEAFAQFVPQGAYLPLVLAELTRYLRQLVLLQENKVRDPREASKILWNARLPAPQTSLAELMRQSRIPPAKQLAHSFRLAFEADLALRSSPADERLVLERFLLAIGTLFRGRRPVPSPQAVAPLRSRR
jgi:DNA polymerase-3 subunit delta